IKAAYNCTDLSTCTTAAATFDPSTVVVSNKVPVAILQGSTDTTTNPTYQGNQMKTDFASLQTFFAYIIVTAGHGADMLTGTNLLTTTGYQAMWRFFLNTGSSGSSGGSTGAGGS